MKQNPPLTPSTSSGQAHEAGFAQIVLGAVHYPQFFETVAFESQRDSAPKPKGWEARPTLGTKFKKAFSTPKVLRQASAIWAQPRWGCFEQGPKTQGRPAAVAAGQPWAGGRNPVGIKGNEAVPQIANLWVMHRSWEGADFSETNLHALRPGT